MVLTHQKILAELTSTVGIIVQFTKENYQSFFRENETQKRKKNTNKHIHLQCVLGCFWPVSKNRAWLL